MSKVAMVLVLAGLMMGAVRADSQVSPKQGWLAEFGDNTNRAFSDLDRFFKGLDRTLGGRLYGSKAVTR